MRVAPNVSISVTLYPLLELMSGGRHKIYIESALRSHVMKRMAGMTPEQREIALSALDAHDKEVKASKYHRQSMGRLNRTGHNKKEKLF